MLTLTFQQRFFPIPSDGVSIPQCFGAGDRFSIPLPLVDNCSGTHPFTPGVSSPEIGCIVIKSWKIEDHVDFGDSGFVLHKDLTMEAKRMPKTTVAAVITNNKDQVLLTRRNIEPFKDQWCLPGGHVDRFERVVDAVVREAKEETGLDFTPRFLDYFDEIIPEYEIHAVVLVFTGRGSGTFTAQETEVTDMGWFSLDKARALPLAFTHNAVLDLYAHQIDAPNTR
jgi:8-oxo-dGTP diphosphatase